MEENGAQISGYSDLKKLQVLEKKFFFRKKSVHLICADSIFKTLCGNFFLHKWVSRYLTFDDFTVPKNFSSP